MKTSVLLLRIIHGFITLYFIVCLLYIYYCAVLKTGNLLLDIAVISVLIEGVLLYIFNNGDCVLIHVQRKIGDDKPFFSLFLPEKMAKRAISYFAVLTIIGLVFLAVRLAVN
jgi:hypothetical protein